NRLYMTVSEEELGNATGNDLVQGNITLPVFFAKKDPAFAELLRTHCTSEEEMQAHIEPILLALHESNAIEESYRISERYLSRALEALEDIPISRAKKTLHNIATYIGTRRS